MSTTIPIPVVTIPAGQSAQGASVMPANVTETKISLVFADAVLEDPATSFTGDVDFSYDGGATYPDVNAISFVGSAGWATSSRTGGRPDYPGFDLKIGGKIGYPDHVRYRVTNNGVGSLTNITGGTVVLLP